MACIKSQNGYFVFRCTIDGDRITKLLHRVVAEHFIGEIYGLEINHKDFNKANNAVSNLEIVTRAENAAHYKGSEIAKITGRKISTIKTKYTEEEKKELQKSRVAERRKLTPNDSRRGGLRSNPGGRPLTGMAKKERYTFRVSPENKEYLRSLSGSAGELINLLLDRERKNPAQ